MIVDTVEEAIVALPRVLALDRRAVRRRFEERFSATRMAKDYLGVYRSLLKRSASRQSAGKRGWRCCRDSSRSPRTRQRPHVD